MKPSARLLGCALGAAMTFVAAPAFAQAGPRTQAERTNYQETSSHASVVAFLDSLTRVLAGQPEHRDLYLTPEEQAANDQFLPCCSRALCDRLVLDLA